jgi:hypothetical protein
LPLLEDVDELRRLADIELVKRLHPELLMGFMLEIQPRPLADGTESTELGFRRWTNSTAEGTATDSLLDTPVHILSGV